MTIFRKSTPIAAALSLTCVLALTACLPGPGESPNNAPAPSATSDQRDASSIREDFYAEITEFTDEAGGDWKYLDGGSFSPDDRASFSPKL